MQNQNNINFAKFIDKILFRLFVNTFLITFILSTFFILLTTTPISRAQYQECPRELGGESYCKTYDPRPPADACYNGWVPGEKTRCGSACPLSRYPENPDNLSYGRPWSKYEWKNNCVTTEFGITKGYCFWLKSALSWYSLGDKAEPGCPNCGSRKTGYLASGQCDPGVSGGFFKVCCKPDGTVGVSNVYAGDTVNPPYESVCTVGQETFLSSVPSLGIYQPPEANTTAPNSGEPHPACKAGLITCTSQVSGNQVTFTANSTQNGTIKISTGNSVVKTYTNTNTCSYTTSGRGNITVNATF
jgi:hypothetical protein